METVKPPSKTKGKRQQHSRHRKRGSEGSYKVEWQGIILPLNLWAPKIGVPYQTLRRRMLAVIAAHNRERGTFRGMSAEETAWVMRTPRMTRTKYLQTHGELPPSRKTRPTFDNPRKSPYYDLTDARFIALRRFARAEDIHMTYIRQVMQDENLRVELLSRTDEYMPTEDELEEESIWINL